MKNKDWRDKGYYPCFAGANTIRAGYGTRSVPATIKWIAVFCLPLAVLLFIIANWCFPLPKAALHPPPSRIVLDRNGEWLRAFLAPDGMWRMPPPEVSSRKFEVSYEGSVRTLWRELQGNVRPIYHSQDSARNNEKPLLQKAMLTSEDRWFYYHFGINPVSIAGALYDNLKAGEIVRGGSTITMQLARLMEPKARNIPNKFFEMFRALQLELAYSKSEILTFYFNMLPYGGNIVGSAAASRFYFNKPQRALSLGEAALLAAIPNSPERLRPDRFPDNARKAREKLLNRLLARGQISEPQWREALQEPIPTKRYPLPFKAPHLSRMVARRAAPTDDGRIYTTIDVKTQDTASRLLHEYLEGAPTDVSTGAVVVMDTKSRHVLAMVGSHDFFDRGASGQVNGALAPRSPGSALKPFVYALAIEQGLITPETLVFDVPVAYAGYQPVNYDGKYNGYVTARRALARSLNVPAVNLYAQLEKNALHTFLRQAGMSTLTPAKKYGLSLVLGGCEVNLLELTTLYAGLANMGEFAPYQLTLRMQTPATRGQIPSEKSSGVSNQLAEYPILTTHPLREETCFIITEMLTTPQRPDFPTAFESTMNLPKIAWKTGTSYGHRDAWCVGYSPTFTIGVWLGNFDGKGSPRLSGADAATPILFALFNALTTQGTHEWFTRPKGMKTREVCALSGHPVSSHCPTRKRDVYIAGVSRVGVCTIHKRVYIDKATGHSVCSHCWNAETNMSVILEEWPATAATWLAENGFAVPVFPVHNPLCTGTLAGAAPIILSPAKDTVYHIRDGVPLEHQKILLSASISNRTQQLFWFLDGELIFKGRAGQPVFLTPVKGQHVLTCIDGEGRSTSRPLHIRGMEEGFR